jgi:AcrR family transcriptional regulator
MVQNLKQRGRPRGFDLEEALKIVADRFRDGGFSATSLDDLARATGLNRPSLYAAFGDKKAMYLAALSNLKAGLEASFDRLEAAHSDLEAHASVLLDRSIDAYMAGPLGARGCLAIGTASAEAVMDADIRASLDDVLALIDRRIAMWFEDAGLSVVRAQLLSGTMHSLSVRARAGQPRETLQAIADEALKVLLGRGPSHVPTGEQRKA